MISAMRYTENTNNVGIDEAARVSEKRDRELRARPGEAEPHRVPGGHPEDERGDENDGGGHGFCGDWRPGYGPLGELPQRVKPYGQI